MSLPCWSRWPVLLLGALLATAGAAFADDDDDDNARIRLLNHAAWRQECSTCHIAYPPQLLPAVSWRAIMKGLDQHFGSDASLDPQQQADILRFLETNAGGEGRSKRGEPLLRITETRWFVHEHSEELPKDIWSRPSIKSAANCNACHTAAERGDYSERTLRIPK